MVKGLGSIELFDAALVHDDNAVGQGKGFLLIVGYQHGADAQGFLNTAQIFTKPPAYLSIEGRKGLIQ